MSRMRPSSLPHRVRAERRRDTAARDRYNAPVRAITDDFDEWDARVDTPTSRESNDDRTLQESSYSIIVEPAADLAGVDELIWLDRRLRIDGPVRPIYDRRRLHHWELDATEVAG